MKHLILLLSFILCSNTIANPFVIQVSDNTTFGNPKEAIGTGFNTKYGTITAKHVTDNDETNEKLNELIKATWKVHGAIKKLEI